MKQKILTVVCTALLFATVFSSCAQKSGGVLKLKSGDVKVQNVIKLDNINVSFDLYRYWFLTLKDSFLQNDTELDFTKKENLDNLLEQTVEQVKYIIAIEDMAKEYGVELTDEQLSEINSQMKEGFESAGSAEEYKKLLSENYLTQEVYERILRANELYTTMSSTLAGTDKKKHKIVFTQDEAVKSCNEDFYRLVDIYFLVETTDEEGNALSEDKINKNKKDAEKKINEAYDKIKEGKSFLEVMREYKDEEEYEYSLQRYYRPETLSLGFDIKSLKVSETTKPFYSNNTYMILHRLENDSEYIKENGVTLDFYNMLTPEQYHAEKVVGKMLENKMDSYKVTELKYYDQIDTKTLV